MASMPLQKLPASASVVSTNNWLVRLPQIFVTFVSLNRIKVRVFAIAVRRFAVKPVKPVKSAVRKSSSGFISQVLLNQRDCCYLTYTPGTVQNRAWAREKRSADHVF